MPGQRMVAISLGVSAVMLFASQGGRAFLSSQLPATAPLLASERGSVATASRITGSQAAAASSMQLAACGIVGALSLALLAAPRASQRRGRKPCDVVAVAAFEEETGVQPPVGFWDPLGFSADGSNFDFTRRREVELKHGRVAMFATMGYIVPEYYKFDGYLSPGYGIKFTDVPNGLAALGKVPALGICQWVFFCGLIELIVYNEEFNGEPGNYGAGKLGLRTLGFMNAGIEDAELRKEKLNAELANGRLAMMAIIGMFFQDGCTGSAWGDWALYTDSPLRAYENELGVQAPVGFWDPLGFTSEGSQEDFVRRRETEIKHGRVCMLATIGYIVPEYYKWPGVISTSLDLKFTDIPNGLAALSKVPGAGWCQYVLFAGYFELWEWKYTGTPGDYGRGLFGISPRWSVEDAEIRKKKLNAEIANGRLAMMAIIGMFFQDGLTGSAWGDWALYTDSPLR